MENFILDYNTSVHFCKWLLTSQLYNFWCFILDIGKTSKNLRNNRALNFFNIWFSDISAHFLKISVIVYNVDIVEYYQMVNLISEWSKLNRQRAHKNASCWGIQFLSQKRSIFGIWSLEQKMFVLNPSIIICHETAQPDRARPDFNALWAHIICQQSLIKNV